MLPGFSGHLISESFLERLLSEKPRQGDPSDLLRPRLAMCRGRAQSLGPASSLRALLEEGAAPLVRELGFGDPADVEVLKDSLVATISCGSGPVALLVTSWGLRLESLWRAGVVHARHRGAPWCLFFNGIHLRLIETSRLYSRRHVQFDLDVALDDGRASAALLTVLGAVSFSTEEGRCESRLHRLVERSERDAADVRRTLRHGVLQAAVDVLGALMARPRPPAIDGALEQALTIVYRILFLLFAEARGLVPLWHPIYRESYSLDRLRGEAERSGAAPGLWDALRAVSRLAHAGCRAGDLRVTAFNGRLFAPSRTPLVERADLDDDAARRALLALATRSAPDHAGRERIAYRDLGVEQLGAVYETVLDYEPRIVKGVASLQPGSGRRKATGTFYTPQTIAQFLIRRTLGPLVRDAAPDEILALKVLDPAMGSGAFLVAACVYLAQAYEAALVRSGSCHATDFGPQEHAAIRRTIAERCLFGVDLNPMAVQLACLSLWLATLAADRPLTFLDHHLRAGDSLLGTWLACLRRPPVRRRRRDQPLSLPLFGESAVGDALRQTLPVRFRLALEPNNTLEQVHAKERALAALNRPDAAVSKWKRVADVWCAQWFSSNGVAPAQVFGALSDQILNGSGGLPQATAGRYLRDAEAIAEAQRFFHWELEFPEAFFDQDGARLARSGFDAVVANPPWDMIRADAGPSDDRVRSRRDSGRLLRFTRDAGVYTAQSDGHANRYQLFVERAVALARAGGRLGLVLPSGLAADHGSASLRRMLLSRCAVDALVGFENRQRVFPIHRSVRFLLLTATSGRPTVEIGCRLGEHDPSVLETADDEAGRPADSWFTVRVTPALLEQLTGDDLAVPALRTPTDLAIAERAATLFPPLGDARGWAARFGRELNATDDRASFCAAGAGYPIIGGRQIEPFRVNLAAPRWNIRAREAQRLLGSRHQRARLAYRDVAGASNRLTLIAAVLPPRCASTHTVFCLRTPLPLQAQHFLCGVFNSLVVNYLARLRVTTHVTTAIVERLPLPRPEDAPAAFRDIAASARRLASQADPSSLARLNARVAELYQLSSQEFEHILGTFPLVSRDERDRALREFQRRG